VRYYYDRTYGVEYGANKNLKNDFTDRRGIVHDAASDFNWGTITLFYRPAMNFSVNLGMGVNSTLAPRLDDNRDVRKGWSWSIGYDFFF